MKINIHKMQNGGGMPPFTYYKPVFVNNGRSRYLGQSDDIYGGGGHSSSSSSKSSSESSKGEITDKDLLLLLDKVDVLPSDMKQLTKQLYKFYQLRDVGLADTSSLATEYIRAIQSLYTAKTNKELFDKVYDKAEKDNVLNEVAIDPSGRIQGILPDGTFTGVNVDELEDYEGFRPVTNLELMNIRSQLKPNDNSILNQVSNGISLQNINKMIKDYLNNLGTSESKTSGYEKRKAQTIEKGLEALQQAQDNGYTSESGLDGLYKVENLTKTQKDQAALAIDYIYDMLPDNAKELLKYHAYKRNEEPTEESAKSIIAKFVLSGTSTTRNHDETMVLDAEGKKLGSKSSSSGGSGGSGINLNPAMAFLLGEGYSQNVVLATTEGNSINITAHGQYGILANHSGEALGATSSLQDVTNSQYAGAFDFDNATFGGHRINMIESENSLLKDATVIGMDLPLDTQAAAKGLIRPDLELMSKIEKADEEIYISNIDEKDYQKINEIYKKYGMQPKYIQTQDGWVLNQRAYARFAAIQSIIDGRILMDTDKLTNQELNTQLVEEVNDENTRKNIERLIQDRTGNKNYDISNPYLWGLFSGDNIYRGTVFIPIREKSFIMSTLAGPSTSNLKFPISDVMSVDNLLQQQSQNHDIDPVNNYKKAPNLSSLE